MKIPKSNLSSQKLSLLVLGVACIALAVGIMFYRNKPDYYSVTNWTPKGAQRFFKDCVYTAERPDSGISDQAAKVYCGCDIDKLQALYKSDTEISQAVKQWIAHGYPSDVLSALHACADKARIPINI